MARPVPAGPRAYRARIRGLGPIVALLPPVLLGALAFALLRGNASASRGVAGFVSTLFAAPVLPILGVPFRSGGAIYLGGAAASAVVWLVLGTIAARRATRVPIATWRNFWGEYAWMLVGVWSGVLLSLVAANLVLGRALV